MQQKSAGRATALLLVAQAVAAGSAFGISLLAAVVMAPAERGELALWLQIVYLASTLGMLGLERPLVAHAQGTARAATRFILDRLLATQIVVAVVAVAALAWLIGGSEPKLALLAIAGASYVLTNMQLRAVRIAFIVSRQWAAFVVVTIATHGVALLGALALSLARVDALVPWVLIYVVSGVAVLLYLSIRARMAEALALDVPVQELMRSAYHLIPASLGNTAMLRSDRLLLPALSSTAQLGLYVMVATATELAAWPVQQFVDASLRKWRSSQPTVLQMHKWTLIGIGIGAAFGLLAGGLMYVLISLWLPAYLEAIGLIVPLALAAAVYSGTRVQQGCLIALGNTRRASVVEVVGMVAAVGCYVVLIPMFGAAGAAWGSLIGYAAGLVLGGLQVTRAVRAS